LDPDLAFVYVYSIIFPFLAAGAFYYAVRLARLAGAFRGWILMIVFVLVFALQAISSLLGIVAVFRPALIQQYLQQQGVGSFISTSSYNVILAAILFAAMFEIYRTFSALQTKANAPHTGSIST
jgi:hypothetical protein